MIDVEAVALGKKIYLTFVYGEPVQKLREQVWERLTRYGLSRTEPWFIIGDFNEITGNHEKDGGFLRSASSFVPFNDMIRNCGLLEFPARGNTFSWKGRRGKGKGAVTIRCRLDRALANEDWHTLFPCSYTEYLGMVASDHRPVVAFLEDKVYRRRGQFRFDKRWIGQDGLMESIASGWLENNEGRTGDVVSKISNSRHEIAAWRKNNPPYGKDKIQGLQKALEEVQSDNNRTQEEILEVSRKLQEAYKDEEEYWHQKSRNTWYSCGDLNTKFYHALTKQRRVRNRIVGLHDETGNWITEENGVEKVAVDYFEDLFTTTSPSDFNSFPEEIIPSITPQMNNGLLRPATEEEVRQALFLMHPEKAPGPDGMTALFFQHAWHIIKTDLVAMVNNFLITGDMDSRVQDYFEGFMSAVEIMPPTVNIGDTISICTRKPRGHIVPQRGLRQGDPLSPYLFIMCTEALIANIKKAERGYHFTGMKVARACPSISHLLFVDDSLFFCKAHKEECHTILRILKEYEVVSGQLINFQKSSIQFGHKIEESTRQELRDILGIQNLGGMGSYLGLPESLWGSKIQVFGFVQDRLNNRVNGWTFKFFSKGGKEVIIKSVVTALPNHVMSVYRLPKATVKKLTSAVSKFWWSPGGNTRGMHWKSWDKVCTNKDEGGLGFKDITDFNTAMLGKQLWRLIEKPSTLFARVFKGRISAGTGLSGQGKTTSFLWSHSGYSKSFLLGGEMSSEA
ncbi:uncharacterized protein LOC111208947 [Brassica napus]|uniref:uncharacterized protein LOC111208947 n=1 Tax=Brassica napus TaxID=3708 RepID=UPI000BBECB03|nr:uncharacterized protein LOC111208947 [Brassica napus]